jgi:hypothetical protein
VYGLVHKPLRRNYTLKTGITTFLISPFLLIPVAFLRSINYYRQNQDENAPLLNGAALESQNSKFRRGLKRGSAEFVRIPGGAPTRMPEGYSSGLLSTSSTEFMSRNDGQ